MSLLNRFQAVSRSLADLAAGAALALNMPASAGIFGGIVERAFEQQVTKHVGERFSQPTATPVSLQLDGSFAVCRQLFPQSAVIDITKVDQKTGWQVLPEAAVATAAR